MLAEAESYGGWYLLDGSSAQIGPLSDTSVCALFASGEISDHTLCWRTTMSAWVPFERVRGHFHVEAPRPLAPWMEDSGRGAAPRADGVARISKLNLGPDLTSRRRRELQPGLVPDEDHQEHSLAPNAISCESALAAAEEVDSEIEALSPERPRTGVLGSTLAAVRGGVAAAITLPLRHVKGWFADVPDAQKRPVSSQSEQTNPRASQGWFGRLADTLPPGSIEGHGRSSASVPPQVFGVALLTLIRHDSPHALPCAFEALAAHIWQPHVLATDGLFRVSAEHARVTMLAARIDGGDLDGAIVELQLRADGDAHVAAALLKRFLNKLPDPVCTHALYTSFVNAHAEYAREREALVEIIGGLVSSLPPPHMHLLHAVCQLLKAVCVNVERTRMNAHALANVLGPTLLRPEKETVAHLPDLPHRIGVVALLISECDRLFMPPLPPQPLPTPLASGSGQATSPRLLHSRGGSNSDM
mmetsp:Transcript_20788/g.61478  ORF Transcript_20788/g.61478 Transcript_20788/m.61478 type:complete len:473 (-) Transcript_20788:145-1563(-)